MLDIRRSLPGDNEVLRRSLYEGALYIIPASSTSLALADDIRQKLEQRLNTRDLTAIHEAENDVQPAITEIRNEIKSPAFSRAAICALLEQNGFNQSTHIIDVLRLRCIQHQGYKNPVSASGYTAHRDSWYANPSCQINWWMPLFDVDERQTFRIYPRHFNEKIANTSASFEYDEWMKKVGFQSSAPRDITLYPSVSEETRDENAAAFSCKAGEILLFSATHLHQTCKNDSGKTRFSIDFRTVHTGDLAARIGAPDPDNESRGDATKDYMAAA